MKYELINPSDLIYFDAPDNIHAAFSTSLLSMAYGGTCLDDREKDSPIFLFGGAAEWIKEKSGVDVDTFLEKNAKTLYRTLLSYRYDSERSSLNNIVESAHKYAEAINKKFIEVSK